MLELKEDIFYLERRIIILKDKRLARFITIAFIFICMAKPIYARERKDSAGMFLCEYALKLYKEGNIDDAVHQLKQALLINPHNSTAKNYLKKILSEQQLPDTPIPAPKLASLNEDGGTPRPDRKLRYQEERCAQELSQRDRKLKELMSYYENRLKIMGEEIERKESKIKEVTKEKDSLLEENLKIEGKHLAEIERIIKILSAEPSKEDKSIKRN